MNRAIIAVAGAGKTMMLAHEASKERERSRVVVLTYTTTNQREDAARISSLLESGTQSPRVSGWCAFLLNEIIRPYLPVLYPDIQLAGLAMKEPSTFQYLKGHHRYFTRDGFAYPSFLGKLAFDVIKASKGGAIRRIENVYDAIYLDEAQDIRGNDLCVLEELLHSRIRLFIVLDPRQSTLSTTSRDSKYKKRYQGHGILELYRLWERKGLLSIEFKNETFRSTPPIASFSDAILGPNIGLERTVSNVQERGYHDGIFLIDKSSTEVYSKAHHATLLAMRESDSYPAIETINFKMSKGVTRDDIIVVATDPIEQFLSKGKSLAPESACGFYVAVTRARYSVAIAVKDPDKTIAAMTALPLWEGVSLQLA